MESCTSCVCAQVNGQWVNPACPQQDCFKYCLPVSDNSAQGFDARTMTTNECAEVYAGNPTAIQRCQSLAIISGSPEDPNSDGIPFEEKKKESNRNIILISVMLVVLIIVSMLIYSL